MDFGKVAKVTKIGTQGRHNAGQWVTKYIVSYSMDGGYFQFQFLFSYDVLPVNKHCDKQLIIQLHQYNTCNRLRAIGFNAWPNGDTSRRKL